MPRHRPVRVEVASSLGPVAAALVTACAPARPAAEPILPEEPIELDAGISYDGRVIALRTSLGRAAIGLEVRGTAQEIRGKQCDPAERAGFGVGCTRCELAGADDALDPSALEAITAAFDRYPARVLEAAQIERVALCRKLEVGGVIVGGAADQQERRMLLGLDHIPRGFDARRVVYLERVVHHELFHLLDYARTPDLYDHDPEWKLHNPLGFEYCDARASGASCESERPAGFVNDYAATDAVEDRASVFEMIMGNPAELCAIAARDPIMRVKVAIVWRRVAAIAGDDFMRARAGCVDWLDPAPLPEGKPELDGALGARARRERASAARADHRYLSPPARASGGGQIAQPGETPTTNRHSSPDPGPRTGRTRPRQTRPTKRR